MAWPAIVDYILQMLVQYIDLFMVGSISVEATAVVGLASQINFMVKFPLNSLGIGVTAYISKAVGEKDFKKVRAASVQTLIFTIGAAAFFSLLVAVTAVVSPSVLNIDPRLKDDFVMYFGISYSTISLFAVITIIGAAFKGIGNMKISMYVNIVVNICNTIFNFLLIYPTGTLNLYGIKFIIIGAGLGLKGAALGTAAAASVGGGIMLLLYYKSPDLNIMEQSFKPNISILSQFIKIGFPAALGSFFTGAGRAIFTSFVSLLGVTALAAHTISYSLEGMFYIPVLGFDQSVITMAGMCLGEKNENKYSRLVKNAVFLSMGTLAFCGMLLFISSDFLTPLMTDSPETAALSAEMLKIVAFSESFFALRIIMEGSMQGIGKTKTVFFADIASMWLFRVIFCGILVNKFHTGLRSVWFCMIADNTFLAFLLTALYLKGSWKKLFGKET
ncbi:MAG: MATE family efflux transporter [Clostridiales bacterium]|nr:MATE family efflux transporter [Clostridiales bacterium]